MKFRICIYIFCIIIFSGCKKKENITNIVLDWVPNTNHTGIYVADELGFYEQEGIFVKIIQPAESTSIDIVGINKAHFGISYQESLTFARSSNIPVVAIASIFQENIVGYATPKKNMVNSPKDFEKKTYSTYGDPLDLQMLKYIVEKDGGDFSTIKIRNDNAFDFFNALENGVDFAMIFESWDLIIANQKKVELDYFPIKDYGIDFYTPIIITNNKLLENNKEFVKKFLNATYKGYKYACEFPEEAAKILTKKVPELDFDTVYESQKVLSSKYMKNNIWGHMQHEIWQNFTDFMYENKILENKIVIQDAYTNNYLP